MKSRFLFILKYFCLWVIIFLVQKIFFLFFNYKESFELRLVDWLGVLYHGLPLDFSTSGYLSAIPAFALIFSFPASKKIVQVFINIYTYIMLFIVLYLGVVDMDLYSYWGFKLDISPLLYIKTPGDALASISIFEIVSLLSLFVLLLYLSIRAYRKWFHPSMVDFNSRWWLSPIAGILLIGLLFIPVRGGFGIAPMNLGRVYFHQNSFVNHSAINVSWNTIYSITKRKKLSTQYNYMEPSESEQIYSALFEQPEPDTEIIIRENANVIFIILESFSNKIIESLGGEKDVTPGLNELCSNAVVFPNFYANGGRSDKAMASIFSGFPTLPTISILDFPRKIQSLPYFTGTFADKGYNTAFYYGGDINFANFRAFFNSASFDRIVTDADFPSDINLQKWGVPDGFLFEKMTEDLKDAPEPFFYSCFTLSSHEPFDVPIDPVFGTGNRDDLSRTSYYYTDQVLSKFLEEGKRSDWWDNTLVVIVADHGSRSPGNTERHVREKFRIPMIWTGGAILKDTIITKTGSQADISATLLSQFGAGFGDFCFSKNLLDKNSPSFAFYAFNNGFAFIDDSTFAVYDNGFEKMIISEGENTEVALKKGMAFLQHVSDKFTALQ